MADDIVARPDIVAFTNRCIDEDERMAQEALGCEVSVDVEWGNHAVLHHIHRWSSARVLAEVQAKRAILELHRPVTFTDITLGIRDADVCWICHGHLAEPDNWAGFEDWQYPLVQQAYPCRTVLALAAPFAGQPGWRDEWGAEA